MIIFFNNTVFQTEDSDIQHILAKILVEILEDNHFVDIQSITNIFFDSQNKYNSNILECLSKRDKKQLEDYISNVARKNINITKLHKTHLTRLVIGTNPEEVHPKDAYRIITERSKVIVENGINDWKFIQGVCQKYSSSKISRQPIYLLLNKAIKRGTVESENSGGVREIKKVTQRWIDDPRYSNISQYKLIAIFDSDKKMSDGQILDTQYKDIIDYLSQRNIIYHKLYKRKIENYIPLNVLITNEKIPLKLTELEELKLRNRSVDELDFLEYGTKEEQLNIGIGEETIKKELPQMFLSNFSYRELEERCKHHKVYSNETGESISEIEEILLKIVKVI
ncbi:MULTISPECIES: hypothetical protein [unclassified Microcystis]|uniref:hypothetical protein n=1 Tax=unclassified Microcystis TaxID=2643300 RepID=UPI002587E717|nr:MULTISPECIES: hypothetical protein [unclassified Microcystis]MCA6534949.1 hypothetical protein [Pseudanabaena sp. M176S2SP2A07QC]MCA6548102.1 hypothetical protein [Pseudanabaena sp. M152S2SP2A07QC]MCA6563472.1 hypothetical protein [Pseudanabaena sp. M151S2SP2A07QC]MCA6571547.1 hypothetical protein [Pseudanabaena sp. M065S1SP2A07QC]MCA6580211.1 hypothetical protein [Pseudanabaena sp. M085S1SP2A07QC]